MKSLTELNRDLDRAEAVRDAWARDIADDVVNERPTDPIKVKLFTEAVADVKATDQAIDDRLNRRHTS